MSDTKTRELPKVDISEVEDSWGSSTLEVLKLPSLRKSRSGSVVLKPPPTPKGRQPELVDKINKELMTYDQLEDRIGHAPHKDRLKGLWKMSKNFKAMRTQMGGVGIETSKSLADLDLEALRKSLTALEKAGKDYTAQHKSDKTRSDVGKEVTSGAQSRQQQLQAVLDDPEFDKVKGHITVEQALDCKARGIRFKDCDFDTLNDGEIKTANEKFGSGNANCVSLLTYKDDKFRVFKAEPVSDDKPLDGVTAIGIDATSPHNGNRNIASTAMGEVLGTSVISKSSFGMHKNPKTQKVEIGLMMEKAEGVTPAQTTYAPYKKPTTGSGVQKAMDKVELDPDDEEANAVLKKQNVRQRADYVKGTSLETDRWEKGTHGLKTPWEPPLSKKAQAALQEQLSSLEWCDALSGQTDRHAFNYFIEVDGDKVKVTGIDNDMAFGEKQDKASVSQTEVTARKTPPGLPQLIDRKLYAEISKKTFDKDVLPKLQGLLNEKELKATKSRFDETKDHALALERTGFVVDDWDVWRHPDDSAKLLPEQRTAAQFLSDSTAASKPASKVSGGLFGRDFAKMFKDEGIVT